jgi:hypothetical protein
VGYAKRVAMGTNYVGQYELESPARAVRSSATRLQAALFRLQRMCTCYVESLGPHLTSRKCFVQSTELVLKLRCLSLPADVCESKRRLELTCDHVCHVVISGSDSVFHGFIQSLQSRASLCQITLMFHIRANAASLNEEKGVLGRTNSPTFLT